jgi:hypothetical protein
MCLKTNITDTGSATFFRNQGSSRDLTETVAAEGVGWNELHSEYCRVFWRRVFNVMYNESQL